MHSRFLTLRRAIPPGEKKHRGENFTMKREKLFYCDICKVVWENVVSTGHVKAYVDHYPILPKIGKPVKTCPDCGG